MMSSGKTVIFVFALAIAWSGTGVGQTRVPSLPPVADALVKQMASAARAQLPSTRLGDGSATPAETREELDRPIVPATLESQTVARGLHSGQMEHCGADWAGASFTPYMTRLRASNRYSAKQLAYVGLLHGLAQGVIRQALRERGKGCPAQASALLTRMAIDAPIIAP